MRKLALLFGCALIFSCGTQSVKNNEDSSSGNTSTPNGFKNLSVTPPNSPVPKQAADSIWNGDYIEKYGNGVVFKRGYVMGGLASGEWLTFYQSGKVWSKGYYSKGFREGYGVSFYENGKKSSEGYYKKGKMVGEWKFWDENGNEKVQNFGDNGN